MLGNITCRTVDDGEIAIGGVQFGAFGSNFKCFDFGDSLKYQGQSVNEIIRRYPSVLPVLNGFGLDTCCGGAQSLVEASRAASIPIEALMAGVAAAVSRSASSSTLVTGTCRVHPRVPATPTHGEPR